MGEEVKRKHFSIECFKNNDIRFYTGLEDYKTFKTLFDSFGPAVKNLVYYGTKTDLERLSSEDAIKCVPKITNSPEQEFFLVLAHLQLGLLGVDHYISDGGGLHNSPKKYRASTSDLKHFLSKITMTKNIEQAFSSHPYTCSCHAQIIIEKTREF